MASDLDAYLAALGVAPTAPAPVVPAPSAPVGAPTGQAGPSTWETVLRAALPALGGFLTARQGTLGSFAGAYADQEAQFRQQARQDEQLRMQQETQRRLRDAEARQLMEDQAQAEYRRAQAKAIQDKAAADEAKAKTVDVQKRLDEAAKNPLLNTLINAFGPDAFALKTPNGNMSLRDAQALGVVVPGELGQPKLPEKKEPKAPSLITVPGPKGKPVRALDGPGVEVYERPRAPKEPKAPKDTTPKVSITRGEGPELDKVRVADPVSGFTQTVSGSALLEKMKRAGIPEEQYDAILKDPAALAELVRTY